MNTHIKNHIILNIFKIGHKLGHHSLYCEMKPFRSHKVTWAKRKALRKELVQGLKRMSHSHWTPSKRVETKWDKLLVPGNRPVHSQAKMSIAHCPMMGGFVFSDNTHFSLGLDIEIAHRVNNKIISRIAKEVEIKQAPDKALLWTAKEASFKCLGIDKAPLMPHYCHIFDWIRFDSAYIFSFSYKNKKGRGGAFRQGELAFSYAQIKGDPACTTKHGLL